MKRALQAGLLALLCSVQVWGVSCPAGYSYYKTITIPAASGSTQTNFPVLIGGTDANLKVVGSGGHVQSGSGYDLVVGDSSGTVLNFERETWTSSTGLINLWFMLSSYLSSGSTVRYLYYGNSSISSDQQNAAATWDTNFKSVYHFSSAGALSLADSTGTNALTNHNTATLGTGKIGGSIHFVASSSQALSGTSPVTSGSLTYSGWIKTTDKLANYVVYDGRGNTTQWGPVLYLDTSGHANFYVNNKTLLTGSTDLSGAWHYLAGTWDGTTLSLYVDGSPITSSSGGSFAGLTSGTGYIGVAANGTGSYNPAADFTNGDDDETRISGSLRSANWIATEYANMTTAVTIGSETSCGASYSRAASDGSLSEALARSFGPVRAPSDGTLAESLSRGAAYGRTGADGSLSESMVRSHGMFANPADGSLSESAVRRLAAMRGPSDGGLAESLASSHGMFANLADGGMSESADRLLAAARALSDSSLGEALSSSHGMFANLADGSLAEVVSRSGAFYRTAGDTGFVSVVVIHGHAFVINISDTALTDEILGRTTILTRAIADLSVSETATRHGAFSRSAVNLALTGLSLTAVSSGGNPPIVVPLDHQSVYEGIGRVLVYRGFVRDGIYTKPVTVIVVTK